MLAELLIGGAVLLATGERKPASTGKPQPSEGPKPLYMENLPDVDPLSQGGNFSRTYDIDFEEVASSRGVPFALLKAHAIRESSLKHTAYRQEPNGKASYGLMQILWWKNSNRFAAWGYPDDFIGDGSPLYEPLINIDIAADIIIDNFKVHKNLRDAVNSYNTGRNEATRPAPHNYVNDVLNYYSQLIGRKIG